MGHHCRTQTYFCNNALVWAPKYWAQKTLDQAGKCILSQSSSLNSKNYSDRAGNHSEDHLVSLKYKVDICISIPKKALIWYCTQIAMKVKDKIWLTIIAKESAWTLIIDSAKVSDCVKNKT